MSALRIARHAKRSGLPFPLLATVRCECGCGFEGVDEVTQFCIEEAVFDRLDVLERRARTAELPEELVRTEDLHEPSLHEQHAARHRSLMSLSGES